MGEPKPFAPEKLVVAVLVSRPTLSIPGFRQRLRTSLEQSFGPIDYQSEELPFAYTHYYDEELGTPLVRQILSFRRLVEPTALARLKLTTNALEDEFRLEKESGLRRWRPRLRRWRPRLRRWRPRLRRWRPRQVNLDPGLLSLARFILASTKDSSHRIPLAEGIFAEITLQYRRPSYRPVPWTYPDYRSAEVLAILREIRDLLKLQIKTAGDVEPAVTEPEAPPPNGLQPD
jgi:hypothetical protein